MSIHHVINVSNCVAVQFIVFASLGRNVFAIVSVCFIVFVAFVVYRCLIAFGVKSVFVCLQIISKYGVYIYKHIHICRVLKLRLRAFQLWFRVLKGGLRLFLIGFRGC